MNPPPPKQSDTYRQNADNCLELAEAATTDPERQRFKRMEVSWRALATEQDWLDGQIEGVRTEEGQ